MDRQDYRRERLTENDEDKKDIILTSSLTELYMLNRQEMLNCDDEYSYYRHLMESISIGYAILGDKNGISKEVKSILNEKDNFPKSRNMDYKSSSRVYTCSTGDDVTGKVTVRPDELELGEKSLRNQQANVLIQRLMPTDRKIFLALIEGGWLKKQTIGENIEKELLNDLLEDLQ